ncbi:hypothetical protein [Thalassomonas actiniarum]|uniref:hypothetical protein n=1 Tax=Thalassomonas actiniarum TaxID=485447 RepID=UPI001F1DE37C|nr:hypothetical protein [Thalassomonas actiniarum]
MDTENITEKTYSGLMAVWHKVATFFTGFDRCHFIPAGWLVYFKFDQTFVE